MASALERQPLTDRPAPPLQLRREGRPVISLSALAGRPVVLTFSASLLDGSDDDLEAIRAELRGLGASLVVVTRDAVWSFRPDEELDLVAVGGRELERTIAAAAEAYGASTALGTAGFALFVVDAKGVVRFEHIDAHEDGLAHGLAAALGAAGRVMIRRSVAACAAMGRREWITTSLVAAMALVFQDGCGAPPDSRRAPVTTNDDQLVHGDLDITLDINGTPRTVRIDPRVSLLDALRERLNLTGTKKGCDQGQCGACTVLIDKQRVNACLTLAIMAQGKAITTIEGLARGDQLHPMQQAFIAEDAFQCGYCTPGQIMSAVGLLAESKEVDPRQIRHGMSGNLCRCGAYSNIVAAIVRAQRGA